jgi:hypothetical protein
MKEFRIITNGQRFRVQRRRFAIWITEGERYYGFTPYEFVTRETAEDYIKHKVTVPSPVEGPWRVA